MVFLYPRSIVDRGRGSGGSGEGWTKRANGAVTLALFGTVLGGAWAGGRAYNRWSKETNLLTAPRARVARLRSKYRRKRENAFEIGGLLGEMVVDAVMAARDAAADAVHSRT
jgi:hypothetical protein